MVKTDNKSVFSWVSEFVSGRKRMNTKAFSELLIRRRLSMLKELCDDYEIELIIELVPSNKNKADELTRIPKSITKNVCGFSTEGEIDYLRSLHENVT